MFITRHSSQQKSLRFKTHTQGTSLYRLSIRPARNEHKAYSQCNFTPRRCSMKDFTPNDFAALIGIDWADRKHDICEQPTGTTSRSLCVISSKPEAIHAWAKELKQRYQKEVHPRRRARLQALWQLHLGKRIQDVVDLTGASYRSVQQWLRWYRQGGLNEVLRRVVGHHAKGKKHRRANSGARETRTRCHCSQNRQKGCLGMVRHRSKFKSAKSSRRER